MEDLGRDRGCLLEVVAEAVLVGVFLRCSELGDRHLARLQVSICL